MDTKEFKFERGYRALITKTKNGKYIYILSRRNKTWQSNAEYTRPFTAKRGAERAIARLSPAK
jgi:hypothetical protein